MHCKDAFKTWMISLNASVKIECHLKGLKKLHCQCRNSFASFRSPVKGMVTRCNFSVSGIVKGIEFQSATIQKTLSVTSAVSP
jgi:hypothetical protein